MAENVVEKLRQMLKAAEAGKLTHLAYHYGGDGKENWGFLNVSERGQFVIPARLAALALADDEDDTKGQGET